MDFDWMQAWGIARALIDRQECLSYYSSMRAFSSGVGIMQDSSLPNQR